ncbi:DnaJ family molecular chaperone [Aestuariivirga sp.]|uniref:J domain-containing protein n=1 Tax=Aestuariivirga sp. TaxID=2650926 RepID=UPI003593CBCE
MFENSSKAGYANRALVALTLDDGSVLNVSIKMSLTNKIADALNSAEPFLDVVCPDGEQMFIAKSSIRQARLLDVPKANQLNHQRRVSDRAVFDPYAVLKLAKGADIEEVRQAYLRLTRIYHPDRMGGFELPDEMLDYARTMQVRINLAYEQIGR